MNESLCVKIYFAVNIKSFRDLSLIGWEIFKSSLYNSLNFKIPKVNSINRERNEKKHEIQFPKQHIKCVALLNFRMKTQC